MASRARSNGAPSVDDASTSTRGPVKVQPTPITAAAAGAFAGIVMPVLWRWLAADSTLLVAAFLVVVAAPAHAFVVGLGQRQISREGAVDVALFKRVAAWLCAALVTAAISQALAA